MSEPATDFKAVRRKEMEARLKAMAVAADDAKKYRLKYMAEQSKLRSAEEATAKKLKPASPYQLQVEAKLTSQTTTWLAEAIRGCVKTASTKVLWVAVNRGHARDVMSRAYPLALQMGYVALPIDKTTELKFANGSVIEFTWPGKT